jgi:hypothetical protein
MTSGCHLAAAEVKLGRCWADSRTGLRRGGSVGKPGVGDEGPPPDFDSWAAQGNRKREKEGFLLFLNRNTNKNSNTSLNSTTKNKCSSMYASVNSYISLI